MRRVTAVSYTHLDVYKRQGLKCLNTILELNYYSGTSITQISGEMENSCVIKYFEILRFKLSRVELLKFELWRFAYSGIYYIMSLAFVAQLVCHFALCSKYGTEQYVLLLLNTNPVTWICILITC